MGNMFRGINRVTLEERLLHRFLLEKLYLSDKKTRRGFLPKRLRKYTLNLVIPEPKNRTTSSGSTRLDLDLFFRSIQHPIPAEVKWDANDLKNSAQKRALQKGKGFCAALNLPLDKNRVKGVDYVRIPYEDFKRWFLQRAPLLVDETVQIKVDQETTVRHRDYWIIPLRGTSILNFKKMMDRYSKKPFWAFQNKPYPLERVFRMKKGDRCLFLQVRGKPGQIRLPPPGQEGRIRFLVDAWYEGEITQPYHMRLDKTWGNFFEKRSRPISGRRWPHFIRMRFDESEEACEKNILVSRPLSMSLTQAVNHFHAPCDVSAQEYGQLLQQLRHGNGSK
ncbi:MAG: hypothetical protein WC895_05460 [Candidatus Shapirobacteria bacterium]|jgi:hypothetical protein